MVGIKDLRLMNDTMITYLTKLGADTKRNEIIKKILEDDKCFFRMTKEDAYEILKDIGVSEEKIEEIYWSVASI